MSLARKIKNRTIRRSARVRSQLATDKVRVSVFRSLNHLYAQIIDDSQQKTIVSCSSLELQNQGSKKEIAHTIGLELAKRALAQGIKVAVFDRGPYMFHGRVKAVAEGLREGGLTI